MLPSSAARRSKRTMWFVIFAVVGLVAGDVGAHFLFGKSLVTGTVLGDGGGERADVILHTVKKEPLTVTVTEKGTLESAYNKDIVCQVRAGTKSFATVINWVIDDGTRVKPGQLLMILDDSALRDQEQTQTIVVQKALADRITAEKAYEIQLKQNESAIATAETNVVLAEIELDKLTGLAYEPSLAGTAAIVGIPLSLTENGSYRAQLDDLTGQISGIESDVQQNLERANWADRMVKLTYMSPAQAQAEHSRLDSSVEKLRSLKSSKALLISHDRKKQLTTLVSDLENKRRALDQAHLEADAKAVQTRTSMESTRAIHNKESAKLKDIEDQIAQCRIKAPEDIEEGSMVVYFKPENNRFGNTGSTAMIEQGAQVKEGQKMLRIPNLARMQVNTKVHEVMVSRIKGDLRVPTHVVEVTQAAMFLNPDLFGRITAAHSEATERVRDQLQELDKFRKIDRMHHSEATWEGESDDIEYEKTADGQVATVRLDSLADKKFIGRVKTVANIASQADMFMSDVKLYQTYVRIEGERGPDGKVIPLKQVIKHEGELLKPDMTAEVTISVDASSGPVLTAPIQSIIGGAEMGSVREVFVKTPKGYDRRSVTLGLYNEKMVEIRSGLNEGDEIVVNPKVLLGDKDKTKTREPGDLNSKDKGKGPPGGGGKSKGGPGGPGGGGGSPKGPVN
jgi:multidrug efflux pump subunit AcrA (membrane-fusion protein)